MEALAPQVMGIVHGTADFALRTVQGYHMWAFQTGINEMDFTPAERRGVFENIGRSHYNQSVLLNSFLQTYLPYDQSDPVYQSWRSGTTTTLEVGSLVAGGVGAVKGAIAFNRLSKTPMQISNIVNRINNPGLQKIDKVIKTVESFLGGKGKIITNADGDMILMRGNKKIRFDVKDPHGDRFHFHLEERTSNGKWIDAGPEHRYYFTEE